MRRLLRVLNRTHPNLTLKLTDLPIPNAYIELNKRDIFFSMLWANGNAVEGPWCMTSVDSSFGKSLAEQFQWMWGNHKDSDYPGFFGRRPAQDDDLEEAPPPLVGNVGEGAGRIEVAAHGPIVKEGPQIHSTSVRMFWEKYLEDDSRKRLLYYGEPLFWRDKHHRVYGRTVGKEHFDGYAGDEISVYPFLDAGEVRCAISFIRWFRSQGVRLQEKSTRHAATIAGIVDDPEEREAHGIVLGLPDVNGLVHGYHRFDDFVFKVVTAGGNTGIARKNEQPPLKYADAGDEEGQTKAFVLVSRRPGREPDTVVTIISSAITRAIEGIGDLLTSERGILGLRKKISFVDPWPSVFQLVFSVTLDNEGAVADQQLHDWWPKPFK